MKNNIIKKLAEKAKNKLLGKSVTSFKQGVCVKVINCEDEEFVTKAKEVFRLSEENLSYNPIKMLMDENVLIKLDSNARERYLLDTIDKYLKAKNSFLNANKVF